MVEIKSYVMSYTVGAEQLEIAVRAFSKQQAKRKGMMAVSSRTKKVYYVGVRPA